MNMMLRSLPLTALSLLLGFFFIFVGSIKISPKVNEDIFRDMQQEFGRFNKVFPFAKYTGWRPYAKNFRLSVGIVEVVCGSILVLIPGPLKELASLVLLVLLGGALYTHYALNDPFERMAPALIFGLLTICRLIILYQVSRKERQEEELIRRLIFEAKSKEETCRTTDDETEPAESDEAQTEDSKKIN